jgi:hypothetical protein
MSQLRMVVECSSMLISTQFFRFSKAVEQFYYALLFSSDGYGGGGAAVWDSWAEIGFHIAVRTAPPAAKESDRLTVDTMPGRRFEVIAIGGNRNAMTRLAQSLQEIEHARTALASGSEDARLAALMDNPAIERSLLQPIRDSLQVSAVSKEKTEEIWSMVKRGLTALTNWQIESVKFALD